LGGSFQAGASGAIYFGGFPVDYYGAASLPPLTISTTPNFQGPGPVQIINANVLLNNFAGNLTLNAGDILAGNIATNGVLNIAGPVSVNAALTNWGTVNWQAGSMVLNNNGASFTGSIWNEAGALWNIQCDQVMDNGGQYQLGQFQNAGTVIKSAGTNTTTFS